MTIFIVTDKAAGVEIYRYSAWQLISSPRTGGTGVVVVDAVNMTIAPQPEMTIDDSPTIAVFPGQPTMTVATSAAVTFSTEPTILGITQ